MARKQAARERLEPELAALAAAAGVDVPKLRVTRFSGPLARRSRDGQYWVDFPARRAVRRSQVELTGSLAHELMHITHDDPYVVPRRQSITHWLLLLAGFSVSLIGSVGIASVVYRLGLLSFEDAALVFWIVVCVLAASTAVGLRRRGAAQDAVHYPQGRPVVELRADLAATRLVGKEPVLAMLAYHRRGFRACPLLGRLDRGWSRLSARTHPPLDTRIRSVRTYDPRDDPTAEAARRLARSP